MALPVLDGNQSATTLSSVVTGGEHIVAHSVVSLGQNAISDITTAVSGSVVSVSNFPASQSTTFGAVTGSVSVLNFPASQTIAGTVTANLFGLNQTNFLQEPIPVDSYYIARGDAESELIVPVQITNDSGTLNASNPLPISGTVTASVVGSVTVGSLPQISGTVTANVLGTRTFVDENANIVSGFLAAGGWDAVNAQHAPIPLTDGGTGVKIGFDDANGVALPVVNQSGIPLFATVTVGNSVTIGSLPAISGTVTVGAMPNGALTTRFGTPTTASSVFATSCVTNSSRKYLLIQNVTTQSNVITVGIGFTPTTTQGIQLTAGAGITFESSYIPTGAVYVLSSVTASNFTILEA